MKDILFGAIIGDMCVAHLMKEVSIKIWNLTKLS